MARDQSQKSCGRGNRAARPALAVVLAAALALGLWGCGRRASTGPYRTGDLAPAPRWEELHSFQWTITRDDFVGLLERVYGDGTPGSWAGFIRVHERHAEVQRSSHPDNVEPPFRLNFAPAEDARRPPKTWRAAHEFPPSRDPDGLPLDGVHVAIDPGHIGGQWARMEERHYQLDGGRVPVREGSMTLTVARHLKPLLEELGAKVTLVRGSEEPVTHLRPGDLMGAARDSLVARGIDPDQPGLPRSLSADREATRLFYRTSEIHARAELVNREIRPDLVLCLHFNAEPWGNPARPSLTDKNHFHMLVNGCYSRGEIALDDQRFALLLQLLQGNHAEELALSESLAAAVADATGLPPYVYTTPNARAVGTSGFVYARNLLANRTFLSPVAFFEPYVMNNTEVYLRVQAGDYEGEREVAGKLRPSIFREYARAVAAGLGDHYRRHRPRQIP